MLRSNLPQNAIIKSASRSSSRVAKRQLSTQLTQRCSATVLPIPVEHIHIQCRYNSTSNDRVKDFLEISKRRVTEAGSERPSLPPGPAADFYRRVRSEWPQSSSDPAAALARRGGGKLTSPVSSDQWLKWRSLFTLFYPTPYYLQLTQATMLINILHRIPGTVRPISFRQGFKAEEHMFLFTTQRTDSKLRREKEQEKYYVCFLDTLDIYLLRATSKDEAISLFATPKPSILQNATLIDPDELGAQCLQQIMDRDPAVIPTLAKHFLGYTPTPTQIQDEVSPTYDAVLDQLRWEAEGKAPEHHERLDFLSEYIHSKRAEIEAQEELDSASSTADAQPTKSDTILAEIDSTGLNLTDPLSPAQESLAWDLVTSLVSHDYPDLSKSLQLHHAPSPSPADLAAVEERAKADQYVEEALRGAIKKMFRSNRARLGELEEQERELQATFEDGVLERIVKGKVVETGLDVEGEEGEGRRVNRRLFPGL